MKPAPRRRHLAVAAMSLLFGLSCGVRRGSTDAMPPSRAPESEIRTLLLTELRHQSPLIRVRIRRIRGSSPTRPLSFPA